MGQVFGSKDLHLPPKPHQQQLIHLCQFLPLEGTKWRLLSSKALARNQGVSSHSSSRSPLLLPRPAVTKSCTLSFLNSCEIHLVSAHSTTAFLIKATSISGSGFERGSFTGLPASSLAQPQSIPYAAESMACQTPMDASHLLWERCWLTRT